METSQPPATPPNSSNRTVLWIVVGVAALCLCAAVGVVAIAGGLMIFNSSTISDGNGPIFAPPTPVEEETSEDVGFTMDIPDGGTDHVEVGTRVNYTSNPPSSGSHYGQWIEAGFYDTTVQDGFIVHNLEHGYVVIWYNCDGLSASECTRLESDIEELVTDLEFKVIGMNRTGNMDHVIALTSWGKLAYLDEFDEAFIRDFYADNLENSPEPEAP